MNADPSTPGRAREEGWGVASEAGPAHRSVAEVRPYSSSQPAPQVVLVGRAMASKWRGRALQLELGPEGRLWSGAGGGLAGSAPRPASPPCAAFPDAGIRVGPGSRGGAAGRTPGIPGFRGGGRGPESTRPPGPRRHPPRPA